MPLRRSMDADRELLLKAPDVDSFGSRSAVPSAGAHNRCALDCGRTVNLPKASRRCQLPTSGEPPLTTAVESSRSSSLSDGSCPHCGHCQEPVAGSHQWGRHRGRQGKARQSRHRRDLGVSPATLYRYTPAAGTANSPSVAEFSWTKPTASVFTSVRKSTEIFRQGCSF